jgi:acyl-CoA thioesterase I
MDRDWLVRFARPRAVLELHDLPPATDALDALALGISTPALRAVRREREAELRALAADLLEHGVGLPFAPGELVVGLGDSITSDALSWFELIAAVGASRGGGARFVNAGISGETTADLRKRVFRIADLQPDWVLVLAGANDCQRHGPGEDLLVSPAETLRNLLALDAALRRTGAAVAWITPPPVDERALSAVLSARGLSFRVADLHAVARAMHDVSDAVVDVQSGFDRPELWEDGLHPSPEGQRLIARQMLHALADRRMAGRGARDHGPRRALVPQRSRGGSVSG